ncbi:MULTISPECIES: DUF4238 domain-containing protein [Serratia]|uniref:DUF4238 domain-containing protein n=1 Tax=Serratia TaxID=613 RepID=UPI000659B13F|nr:MULTISPECIES: DUF4238 domain-containing protein [Serratia]KMJ04039.1 hypothetical protein SN04_04758 [Serratia marcescens]MBH2687437.1 DUF4238 domain-containing protein [Serratia ureilytica]
MKQSRRHHYVPEWYQRRFIPKGDTSYYRLDLHPDLITTPHGDVIRKGEILRKGPAKFFHQIDLYTTKYFGVESDDIERYLFGEIDSKGALALAVLSADDWMGKIHDHVINFYEYIDAQRLRTPKGLNWLTKEFNPRNQNELLMRMQYVRKMHCTMWAEASLEIVSAKKSSVKFIVSDNPVTFYNPEVYPGNVLCKYPFDPSLTLQGTRTIFPLDSEYCIIITHKQFARKPGKFKALKPRINARYFDSTVINYHDFIRERYFTEKMVASVNFILKTRAERYIAASNPEWLYPEKVLKSTDWASFDKIFISKSIKLLGDNVEIFFGGENGELIATQDEYGRKPKNRQEWEEKEKQAQAMHEHILRLLKKHRSEGK